MAIFEPTDGMPEKLGRIIGGIITLTVYGGIAWMMATASGLL